MPLLRQNLGDQHWRCIPIHRVAISEKHWRCIPIHRVSFSSQHWTCIPTTICAMLLVLMRPAHRRQTNASVLLSLLLHLPHERMPRRIRPPRRIRLPRRIRPPSTSGRSHTCLAPHARHMSGPTRQTHVRPHNQDETRVRTHRKVASQRLRAAKRRAGGTSHFARAMRCSYRRSQKTLHDRATSSSKPSWIQELRRVFHFHGSSQDLWFHQPCPRREAVTASQTANACQTWDSNQSISRLTRAYQLA